MRRQDRSNQALNRMTRSAASRVLQCYPSWRAPRHRSALRSLRRPARLKFLRALCVSVVMFTTEAQRPQRVLCVACGGTRISLRVFRVVRGYIPSAVTLPAVAAVLQSLAGANAGGAPGLPGARELSWVIGPAWLSSIVSCLITHTP